MSEKNENRWWENYLVRYLVPSIAGMFILMWLNKNSGGGGILEKYLPMLKLTDGKDFNTASLTGWLLLGTLYCYIASYPILVLHAVRVYLLNKKNISHILGILLMIVYMIFLALYLKIFCLILIFVIIFSGFQCYFLYEVAKVTEGGEGYDYMKHLTKAKNPVKTDTETNAETNPVKTDTETNAETNPVKTDTETNAETNPGYIKDITDSYKHLREHGNTALIILLEVLLAFILYFSLHFERENKFMDFSIVSIILIIWIFPAALVYFYGHLLERKFSEFDNKENK